MKRFLAIAVYISLFVLQSAGFGADVPLDTRKPIDIKSERLEANNKKGEILFAGNVVARQGNLTITCREMRAYYDSDKKAVRAIDASGDVKITQGKRIATGTRVEFNNVARIIDLIGDARIWEGTDIVEGNRIRLYIDEDRVVVQSANAKITPKKGYGVEKK
jgi:lipopolysaccharide export system protein LptA